MCKKATVLSSVLATTPQAADTFGPTLENELYAISISGLLTLTLPSLLCNAVISYDFGLGYTPIRYFQHDPVHSFNIT